MITQELTMYIREALRRKMTFDTIKSELLRVGWTQEDITYCYDVVLGEIQGTPKREPSLQETSLPTMLMKEATVQQQTVQPSSFTSFSPQNSAVTQKKKISFFKIFFIISILVIFGFGGAAYAGVFLNDTMVQTALVKGISSSSVVESDISLSFSPKQEDKDASTSSLSIQGQHEQALNQFSYKASFNGGTKETNVNVEIRSVDDVLYLFTQDLPEFFMTELLAYENQWFRIPLTKEGIEDVSTQDLEIPSFATDTLQTFSGGISDDMKKKIQETSFLKIVKKEKIVFVDMVPYYKVEFSPNYEAIAEILMTQEVGLSLEEVSSQVEKIKQSTDGAVSMYMWIGVLDGKAHKVEIASTEDQEGTLSLKGIFQFSKKASAIEAPSVSYTVPEFVEKARSGLIPNLMIDGVPYGEYREAKMLKGEQERLLMEQEEFKIKKQNYLNDLLISDTLSSYFLANKKSFVGICKSIDENYSCRESRVGFIVYTQTSSTNTEPKEFLCIDAYTKDIPVMAVREPAKLRCL